MPALLDTIDNFGQPIYYSERFRQMVEDHLLIIRDMSTTTTKIITEDDWATLYRYVGDFNGFLSALNIQPKYHWTIMRINGFRSRFDLTTEVTRLIFPDWEYVDKLAQLSKEKRKS